MGELMNQPEVATNDKRDSQGDKWRWQLVDYLEDTKQR